MAEGGRRRLSVLYPGLAAVLVLVVGAILARTTFAPDQPGDELSPLDRFYRPPVPFTAGDPGDLVRREPVGRGELAGSVFRVMYHSRSLVGRDIAVTGLVIVPAGPVPDDGRPIVTIGHPSTGVADVCAPSRSVDNPTPELVNRFLARGWVVAISDYEGQGPPGRHPYLVGPSEGRSLLDIARAARRLPSAQAGNRVGIWGHSQGGHAALFAQQIASSWAPELRVVGAVAAAPVTSVLEFLGASGFSGTSVTLLTVAGYSAAYPELRPEQVLSDAALAKLDVVDRQCLGSFGTRLDDLDPSEVYRTDLARLQPWRMRLDENAAGAIKGAAPVLIMQGEADQVIAANTATKLFARMCRTGQNVDLRLVADVDHGGIVDQTADEVADWIAARFGAEPARSTCGRS